MRAHEERRCPNCDTRMRVVQGSDRTMREKVWFIMRCPVCGHTQMEWATKRDWQDMGVLPW